MHHWQDFLLSVCVIIFNLALLPSIKSKHKPSLATSLINVAALLLELIAFISLSLWYAAVMVVINATLWAILALQRYAQITKLDGSGREDNQ